MPAPRPHSTTARKWRRSWADRAAACRTEDLPHRPCGPAGIDRRGRLPLVRCGAAASRAPGTTIGMSHIKQRRLTYQLNSRPGLRVGDCVPFYFCPRSIMLYVIHMANSPELDYRGGQGPIVHLEADLHEAVDWAERHGRRWAFTLSNAGSRLFPGSLRSWRNWTSLIGRRSRRGTGAPARKASRRSSWWSNRSRGRWCGALARAPLRHYNGGDGGHAIRRSPARCHGSAGVVLLMTRRGRR